MLAWSPMPAGAGVNVYRTVGDGELQGPLNPLPVNEGEFEDRVRPEEEVVYSLRAVMEKINGAVLIEGPAGAEIKIGPEDYVPEELRGLEAVAAKDKVLLYWDASPETWVRGYKIFRSSVGDGGGEFLLLGKSRT